MGDFEFSDKLLARARDVLSRRAGRALEPREVAEALRSLATLYGDSLRQVRVITERPEALVEMCERACDALVDGSFTAIETFCREAHAMARLGRALRGESLDVEMWVNAHQLPYVQTSGGAL